MAADIFDNKVICNHCNEQMHKIKLIKNGFSFRAIECRKCGDKTIHPEDKIEYQHFQNLRNKDFSVKLRMVGNSYTVSIPKEIVNFINEQNKLIDDMVKLNFERMGKLSLIFDDFQVNEKGERINKNG